MSKEMQSSWLVQRLHRPMGSGPLDRFAGAFSFGGGLKNGGLSDDAMGLLRSIFSFDYMGAAEFEWGAVPKALSRIADGAKHLTAWSFDIDGATVYVLCDKAWTGEVESRIRGWAAGRNNLKEQTRLGRSLKPEDEYDARTCGWLELDNGFFFFTDAAMWKATADLFGVKVREAAA